MVLFMLAHAGGSARSYCSFKKYLPKELQLIPMECAGHGLRMGEDFFGSIPLCAADLLNKHADVIKNEDYAFFGHSMGTMIICELTKQIRAKKLPEPCHVFLSGRCAINENIDIFPNPNVMSDKEIVDFFVKYKLFPKMDNPEIFSLFSGILCSDIRMTSGYNLLPEQFRFNSEITVLYGNDDIFLQNFNMYNWSSFSTKGCSVIQFPGGHFYYNDHKKEICNVILNKLEF